MIRQIYAQLDDAWKVAVEEYEERTGNKFPCGPGCADCCRSGDGHMPFIFMPMREVEAEVLWESLTALPVLAQGLIISRALCSYAASCILLGDDGLCMVYEGRPLWCRIFGLSGLPTCGKVTPGAGGARWEKAVQAAYGKLKESGDAVVSLRDLIDRLIKQRRQTDADHRN